MHCRPIIVACTMLALLAGCAPEPKRAPPRSRAEAVEIVKGLRRIVGPQREDRLEKIRIGGVDQWLSIRAADRRNPILLILHGGPGYVSMPTAWYFQRGLEDYFTVVNWDQRGAGKTFASNDVDQVEPTLTIDRMFADAEEVAVWLRREYGRERIFVLGHSWGSYLGLTLADRHPDWLHAYIGVGQATDLMESERRGYRFAMEAARRARDSEGIAALEAIAPYAQQSPPSIEHLLIQRRWLGKFGGVVYGRSDARDFTAAVALAPEYDDRDLSLVWTANDRSVARLLPALLARRNLSRIRELGCPLILFNGRHDYNVSASVAAEWFERVQAPSKTLIWFERSGHEPLSEEPGRALLALVAHARPIAERAGDVAPYSR